MKISTRVAAFAVALILVLATGASATTFIVPTDDELIAKSGGIVTGVVLSARSVESEPGYIETVYEIAVDRVLKGPFAAKSRLSINSPGGTIEGRYTVVHSAAHFQVNDEVLLFLTEHRGGWTPTDLTLGKFRFATTSRGYGVVVRDAEDIVGWDRDGKVHQEKVRLEAEFINFIQESVAGRGPKNRIGVDYEVEAGDVLAPPVPDTTPIRHQIATEAASPSNTYSVRVWGCNGSSFPARWTTVQMLAGVQFFKNAVQNSTAAPDGTGVSIIQSALNAWTSDCASLVNIPYGGTTASLKNPADNVNAIVFNDPGNHVSGSWGGSGTIAITFSQAGATEDFDGGEWANFTDTDIVFQNGFPGNHAAMNTAMTHEVGHAIGLRHADKDFAQVCTIQPGCVLSCNPEANCNPGTQECAATSIMTATANSALGFTLQAWDISAAGALYPGGSCVTLGAASNVVATGTTTTNVNITWTAGTGALSYNVYRSTNGTTFTLAGNTASTAFNDTVPANGAYRYKVHSVNVTESGASNIDVANTFAFTDSTITAGTTKMRHAHITELRSAVDAMRTAAGLTNSAYTDGALGTSTRPRAVHISELRTRLDAARGALGLTAGTYTDPTLTAQSTQIKRLHIIDLRTALPQ